MFQRGIDARETRDLLGIRATYGAEITETEDAFHLEVEK